MSVAIVFEVLGTTSMKLSDGFSKPLWTLAMVASYVASFGLMTLVLKQLDVGVVYAIWSGAGTALIAAIGIIVFREPVTALKLTALALIVGGVTLLNVSGTAH